MATRRSTRTRNAPVAQETAHVDVSAQNSVKLPRGSATTADKAIPHLRIGPPRGVKKHATTVPCDVKNVPRKNRRPAATAVDEALPATSASAMPEHDNELSTATEKHGEEQPAAKEIPEHLELDRAPPRATEQEAERPAAKATPEHPERDRAPPRAPKTHGAKQLAAKEIPERPEYNCAPPRVPKKHGAEQPTAKEISEHSELGRASPRATEQEAEAVKATPEHPERDRAPTRASKKHGTQQPTGNEIPKRPEHDRAPPRIPKKHGADQPAATEMPEHPELDRAPQRVLKKHGAGQPASNATSENASIAQSTASTARDVAEVEDNLICSASRPFSPPPFQSVDEDELLKDPGRWKSPDSDDRQALTVIKAGVTASTVPVSALSSSECIDQLEQDDVSMEPKQMVPSAAPSDMEPVHPAISKAQTSHPPCAMSHHSSPLPPSSPPPQSSPTSGTPRFSAAQKGKYVVRSPAPYDYENDVGEAGDSVDEDGILGEGEEGLLLDEKIKDEWEMRPGPLSSANKTRCHEFGQKVMAEAEALAKQLNKPTRKILMQAGLLTLSGHSPGIANEYRCWHATEHPKEADESMASWRERVKEDYEEWKTEVWDPADEAERKDLRASLRPCIDGDLLGQSASRRVRAASKQFSGLAQAYSNVEDIEIVGAVVYTGTDDRGRTASSLFGGSQRVRIVLDNAGVPVRTFLDTLETCLKATKLTQQGLRSSILQLFAGMDGEKRIQLDAVDADSLSRDAARSRLSGILAMKLAPFVARTGQKIRLKKDTFPWTRWLVAAWDAEVCLVNWDDDLSAPGPDFLSRSLPVGAMRSLISKYVVNSKAGRKVVAEVDIVPWTNAQKSYDDDDLATAQIPLVTSVNGKVIYKLGDCKEWVMRHRKKRKRDVHEPKVESSRHVHQSDDHSDKDLSDSPVLAPQRKRRGRPIIDSDEDEVVTQQDVPLLPSLPPPELPVLQSATSANASPSGPNNVLAKILPRKPSAAPRLPSSSRPHFVHQRGSVNQVQVLPRAQSRRPLARQAHHASAGFYPPMPAVGGSGPPSYPGVPPPMYPNFYPPHYYGAPPMGYQYPPHMVQAGGNHRIDRRLADDTHGGEYDEEFSGSDVSMEG